MQNKTILSLAATLATASLAPAQGLDFVAPPGETLLNTAWTLVATTTGVTQVRGGLFYFNSVTIPAGSTVRGVGPNPMIWVVNNMQVDGVLTVNGRDGRNVDVLQAANYPKVGGLAGPGGGNGGSGSPSSRRQSFIGEAGRGPGNTQGRGGTGGLLSFVTGCDRGSGGGGGSFATAGDPWFKTPAGSGTSFLQRRGFGGVGCTGDSGTANRTLLPGAPGPTGVHDTRSDNNFFGVGYDYNSQQFIQGELLSLRGGSGGGGGGDMSWDDTLLSPSWSMDSSGAGGGGGGGSLVIAALSNIVVGDAGKITANGGSGGGGEQAGSCNQGGGGGAGSGGLLILAARGQIVLHVKGETYANNDYQFVLSADGGVCTTSGFGAPGVLGKYPANGQQTIAGNAYDSKPLGGFGGMGVVELVTMPGTNVDGTNTRLDDNIQVIRNGVTLTGLDKQRYLAWRGYQNGQGQHVDDNGLAISIGSDEGDIRPTPVLLPIF